jgi:OPT family small oligopeptide transporter
VDRKEDIMASRQPYVNDISAEGEEPSMDEPQDEKFPQKDIGVTVENIQEFAEKVGENQNAFAPLDDVEHVIDKVNTLSVDECREHIEQLLKDHEYDYNFSDAQRRRLEGLLAGPDGNGRAEDWELQIKTETAINKFFSPYPEVRAVTTPDDDPSILCETIRAHLLGYLWAVIAQFVNSLFNSRLPAITFQSAVAQILLYPSGKLVSWILPDWGFTVAGKRHSLNPGPWTYKEQMLATIIVDVSWTSAYVFWNIQTQTVYYGDKWLTPGYKILLLLATQSMGLGFAGLLRRFAVYPTQTFWPNILPTLALNRALLLPEPQETINGWRLSRYKFFFIAFGAMFVYFWLPNFLFNGLSYFAWMTWIAPNNFNLAVVTGSDFGLGFNPISSFDWNVFATYSFPLTYPFFSFVQQYSGTVLGGLIILALYFSNTKWTSYLPPNTSGIYDNTGNSYNITRVVNNGVLDEAAYQAYSPAFYGAGNLVVYGAFFAFYTLTFVFILLDSWRPLVKAYRQIAFAAYKQVKHAFSSLKSATSSLAKGNFKEGFHHLYHMLDDTTSVYDGFDDPFTNMMRNYAEVPDWWFLAILVVSFIFAIILLTQYPGLNTPVWTIFFVIALNLVFLVPMTYLFAISGTTEGLNVITELVVGYALPGHPEALMFVKAFGYNINGQADFYVSDQKMGLYAKIPPRAMYRGQLISAIITAFVAYGVVQFVDNDIQGICTPDQAQKFNCENGSEIYFSSSVIWGAIGPKRIFNQIYPALKYCFLLGFLLAIVWWTVKRVGVSAREWFRVRLPAAIFTPLNVLIFAPVSWLRDVHPSLVLNGMLWWAPLNLTYFTSGLYFSVAFMYYLKRYKTAWWEKYNYVLAAAFNGGVAFSGLIIFFAVQYHPVVISWVSHLTSFAHSNLPLTISQWGNTVIDTGVDGYAGQGALITDLPAKGYFGPDTWT